jgi:creatinine amidohydrolase
VKEVRWECMFPDELEAAFAQCPVAYFSYGMCEPHGPHNSLGLDGLKAHAIACKAAEEHGGIVAPPDWWHVHEIGGYGLWASRMVGEVQRKWLTAVPPAVHFRNVCYHVRAADSLGFHAAIFLTGHYGPNWMDLKTVLGILQPHTGTRLYGLPDFEANLPGFDKDNKSGADHAGKVETSLLMALEPSRTDASRLPPPEAPGTPWAMGPDARLSDRRVGERMVADEVAFLGRKAGELLRDYEMLSPRHTLRTFVDVERIWAGEIAPRIPGFECVKANFEGSNARVPDGSVWRENLENP